MLNVLKKYFYNKPGGRLAVWSVSFAALSILAFVLDVSVHNGPLKNLPDPFLLIAFVIGMTFPFAIMAGIVISIIGLVKVLIHMIKTRDISHLHILLLHLSIIVVLSLSFYYYFGSLQPLS